MIKKFKEYTLFLENIGSPLLSIENNVDQNLIEIIEKEVDPGGKILEISCGNGSDSLQLQKLGYQVTCTEFNPEYVENARELGLDCYLHNTKDKFKFTDKEFDLVYSRLGLHYFSIDELNKILSEINRISNKILITVKVVDDIKTGKIILTPNTWENIISKYFKINKFEVKEGELYGSKSGWVEVLADSIDLSLNESTQTNLPEQIEHRDALSRKNRMMSCKFSNYQIEKIKEIVPVEYKVKVAEGGGWHDPGKKLEKTYVNICSWNNVQITALEDEYFMIQRVRDGMPTDHWWLCDGFDQVIEWLKDRYN